MRLTNIKIVAITAALMGCTFGIGLSVGYGIGIPAGEYAQAQDFCKNEHNWRYIKDGDVREEVCFLDPRSFLDDNVVFYSPE